VQTESATPQLSLDVQFEGEINRNMQKQAIGASREPWSPLCSKAGSHCGSVNIVDVGSVGVNSQKNHQKDL